LRQHVERVAAVMSLYWEARQRFSNY